MDPAWYFNVAVSFLLQGLLLWRGFRAGLSRLYPFFYAYVIFTALRAGVVSAPSIIGRPDFSQIYWWSHIFAALLRFGIAAEIYRYVFPRQSPIRRRAGIIVVATLGFLAFVYWMGGAGPGHYILDALRKIALTVAAWILVVLGIAHYYGVRIGRNVWGMAIGLLTFTGSELVHLSAMDLLPSLRGMWGYVHPVAFVAMLMVWTYALWGYYPNPRTVLDDSRARSILSAWEERWAEVPNALRRLVRP